MSSLTPELRNHAGADVQQDSADFMTADDVQARLERGEPLGVIDARAERSFANSTVSVPGAVRVRPSDPVREVERLKLPKHTPLVVFCE